MSHQRPLRVLGASFAASAVVLLAGCGGQDKTPPPPPPPVTQPPTPAPTPTPVAEPSAPPASIVEAPSPAAPAKGLKPGKTAPAAPAAPKVVADAEAAVAAGDFDKALKLYERAAVEAPRDKRYTSVVGSLKRRFVPSLTDSWSTKNASQKMSGFEAGGVAVKRVPENEARLDFVITPPRVRPGDAYRIDIHLTNAGKKPIRVNGVTAVRNADGKKDGGAVKATDKRDIESRQRERIATVQGTWPVDLKAWSMDVNVAAANGDAYAAKLRWE